MFLLVDFSLLHNSQTFVGTIATIVAMCILKDNNFMITILEQKVNEMKADRKSYLKKLEKISEPLLKEINSWERIEKYDSSNKKYKSRLLECRNKIRELHISYNTLLSDHSRMCFIPNVQVKDDTILVMASFYTLCFIFITFCFDELLSLCGERNFWSDLLVSSLSSFTFFSYIFWIYLWRRYARDVRGRYKITGNIKSKITDLDYIKILLWVIRLLTISVFLFICNTYVDRIIMYILPSVVNIDFLHLSLVSSISVSISALLLWRLRHYITDKKRVVYVVCSIGISCLILLLIARFFIPHWQLHFLYASDSDYPLWGLKVFVISFMILNGLFGPFILVYWVYWYYCRQLDYRIDESIQEFERKVNILLAEYQEQRNAFNKRRAPNSLKRKIREKLKK